MKKVIKSKKGFTLLEMILVVAIIIILAGAFVINISGILESAKNASSSVDAGNETMVNRVQASEAKLAGYGF